MMKKEVLEKISEFAIPLSAVRVILAGSIQEPAIFFAVLPLAYNNYPLMICQSVPPQGLAKAKYREVYSLLFREGVEGVNLDGYSGARVGKSYVIACDVPGWDVRLKGTPYGVQDFTMTLWAACIMARIDDKIIDRLIWTRQKAITENAMTWPEEVGGLVNGT